ncbi:MAG: prepilin-type N-terminal cleavage/methylation domain-containing protein [Candidatus Omnitrophica bacterium]|nr:prepilin-type N-terminal cleavage/methylation domain-containing protein [Candidatus Omnitrophota bacterium]
MSDHFDRTSFARPRPTTHDPRLTGGFTLVEILLTVSILAIGVIVIHQAFSRCIEGIRRSEETLQASLLLNKSATELAYKHWISWEATVGARSLEGTSVKNSLETVNNNLFDRYDLTVKQPSGAASSLTLLFNQHGTRTSRES